MNKSSVSKSFNRKSFHDFVELSPAHQAEVLRTEAQLLDTEVDGNSLVNLYYLSGFFVEEILHKTTLELQFILPYKRGFRIRNYLLDQNGNMLGQNYIQHYPYHN